MGRAVAVLKQKRPFEPSQQGLLPQSTADAHEVLDARLLTAVGVELAADQRESIPAIVMWPVLLQWGCGNIRRKSTRS
jgi:hypothetical protein